MMSQRSVGIAGAALLTLLCSPRESAAGFGDTIWGMSGPYMYGLVAHCRVPVSGTLSECHILNKGRNAGVPDTLPLWFSLEGGLYASSAQKSAEGDDYHWGDVWMLTFEPLVEWRWPRAPELHSGVGVGYNYLFGQDFDKFDKFNIKFRLIGVESTRADLAVNLRIYPRGFTSDEFGFGPREDIDRPAEAVIGFSIGFRKLWLW
jgi:hypothetical protein